MKKIAISSMFILCAASAVLGVCGLPQPVHGRVTAFGFPVFGAIAELRDNDTGKLLQTAMTSPFGWYRFEPVLPCGPFRVSARHKRFAFISAVVRPVDFPGTPEGVRVDLAAITK